MYYSTHNEQTYLNACDISPKPSMNEYMSSVNLQKKIEYIKLPCVEFKTQRNCDSFFYTTDIKLFQCIFIAYYNLISKKFSSKWNYL